MSVWPSTIDNNCSYLVSNYRSSQERSFVNFFLKTRLPYKNKVNTFSMTTYSAELFCASNDRNVHDWCSYSKDRSLGNKFLRRIFLSKLVTSIRVVLTFISSKTGGVEILECKMKLHLPRRLAVETQSNAAVSFKWERIYTYSFLHALSLTRNRNKRKKT